MDENDVKFFRQELGYELHWGADIGTLVILLESYYGAFEPIEITFVVPNVTDQITSIFLLACQFVNSEMQQHE